MKSIIRINLFLSLQLLLSAVFAGDITITGVVYENGIGKYNVKVIWVDSATQDSNIVTTNWDGAYYTVLSNINSKSGSVTGYIVDCKGKQAGQKINYVSNQNSYLGSFDYCAGSGSGSFQSLVSGSVCTELFKGVRELRVRARLIELDSCNTKIVGDTSGSLFSFRLPDSTKKYLVQAYKLKDTNSEKYVPTYGDSAIFWNSSDVIPPSSGQTFIRNIWLQRIKSSSGSGKINGKVVFTHGKFLKNKLIFLLENKEPIAYTYSDSIGNFSFDNLAYGRYDLHLEQPGFTTYSASITVSSFTPIQSGARVVIDTCQVKVKINPNSIPVNEGSKFNAFPNPVQDQITIQFGHEITRVEIKVYDLTGKKILSKAVLNKQEVFLSLKDFKNGLYFIHILSRGNNEVIRIVKN